VAPVLNLHNHPIGVESLSHKLPAMIVSDIAKTLDDNPYLTTRQLQCGQGLDYRPGSVDVSASSYDRIDHHRKKILQDTSVLSSVVGEMEKIAVKVDCKDAANEGSSALSEAYKKLGRPYMRDFA